MSRHCHYLSRDDRGRASPYLERILATHWIRMLLISAYARILLAWTIIAIRPAKDSMQSPVAKLGILILHG